MCGAIEDRAEGILDMLRFWAGGVDEYVSRSRTERRQRVLLLWRRKLVTKDRETRMALSEEIRAVKQRYREEIRRHRNALHLGHGGP